MASGGNVRVRGSPWTSATCVLIPSICISLESVWLPLICASNVFPDVPGERKRKFSGDRPPPALNGKSLYAFGLRDQGKTSSNQHDTQLPGCGSGANPHFLSLLS